MENREHAGLYAPENPKPRKDLKQWGKIILASIGIFAFSAIMVAFATAGFSDEQQRRLNALHDREVIIEQELSVEKLNRENAQKELDRAEIRIIELRTERAKIWEERNAIINEPLQSTVDLNKIEVSSTSDASNMQAVAQEPPQAALAVCTKKDVDEDQQQYVRMASIISNNDLDFLALLEAENGLWTPDRIHNDGVGRGFCGISYPWHKKVIEDPRFLADPKWQLEKCYEMYKGGVKFYGKSKIPKTKTRFECPSLT